MIAEYLIFLAKTLTIVVAILLCLAGILAIASKGKLRPKYKLEIKKLNDKYQSMCDALAEETLDKKAFKQYTKQEKLKTKEAKKLRHRKRIFVLDFIGDIRASAVKSLREEITALLTVATPEDEIVLRLESPGGLVPAYGLAASQLTRIRKSHIPLTITIDKVAASGGYMMAAVANQVIAAPFAIVGSIGVVAQIPNFHRLLKKNEIDYEQIMAGQYKRTLTLFGENTEQGRHKLQEEVEETQKLFKLFINEHRPTVSIDQVATGEHWYGIRAQELKLVDHIMTSDDYLLALSKNADIFEVHYTSHKTLFEKLSSPLHKGADGLLKFFTRKNQDTISV